MLLACFLPLPYGYYILVRFVAMIVFALLGFIANHKDDEEHSVFCFALAVLFQPFYKFALGGPLWLVVDVVCAIYLFALAKKYG